MRKRIFLLAFTLCLSIICHSQKSLDEIDRDNFHPNYCAAMMRTAKFIEIKALPKVSFSCRTLVLDGDWQMAEGGEDNNRLNCIWTDKVNARVPGSVHSALIEDGIIPDPYIGQNDSIAQQQSYKTWWFRKDFNLDKIPIHPLLSFGGIANKCTIWLNGKILGKHEGMFGGPEFIPNNLKIGENTLIVKLDPIPGVYNSKSPFEIDHSWQTTVVINCVYGWHYAKIPSLGIWRSVKLQDLNPVEIANPFIVTENLNGKMKIILDVLNSSAPIDGTLYMKISPKNFIGANQYFKYNVKSSSSKDSLALDFNVSNPQLWWPNDKGPHSLYNATIMYVPAKGNTSEVETTFGIRTIEMRPLPGGPQKDKYNWTFVINGQPMFIKGTGWCTMNPLLNFNRNRYDRFLYIAKLQHVQMIRAWGGGMPETDDFYNLCDEYGILVMQEWPTAWDTHNSQPYNVLEETVRLNTLRIRNHPSLAMYGGGNESAHPTGKAINMMGKLSIELDGTRAFHRGEPCGGSQHNYNCWWDYLPLDHNLNMTASFWGEFGIASLPDMETVMKYLGNEKNIWPPKTKGNFIHHTPVFGQADEWNRLVQYSGYFMSKDSLSSFLLGSQLAQVEGVRHTLERARTLWPNTSGALYYKMNDVFPAVSWSCVDFYGAIKPLHYFAQRSFSPLAAVMLFNKTNYFQQEANIPVFLLDDNKELANKTCKVKITSYNDKWNVISTKTFDCDNKTSSTVTKLGDYILTKQQTKSQILFHTIDIIDNAGRNIFRNFYFSNYDIKPGTITTMQKTKVKMDRQGNVITLTNIGNVPAVGISLEAPGYMDRLIVSENFIWLNPGESKKLTVNIDNPIVLKGWNL
jgi:beta-mannosidase